MSARSFVHDDDRAGYDLPSCNRHAAHASGRRRSAETGAAVLNDAEIPDAGTLGRIVYDGCNLTLGQGTGIATYTRTLTRIAQSLGYEIGVVYGSSFNPDKNPLLQEILFFDQMRAPNQLGRKSTPRRMLNTVIDQIRYTFP